jgi:alcohol dehydrogenase class IV
LAALARHVGLNGRSDQALADAFCAAVQRLNQALGIPAAVAELREADIAALAQAACDEADLNYPVPRRMAIEDCEGLLREVLPKAAQRAGAPRRRSPS